MRSAAAAHHCGCGHAGEASTEFRANPAGADCCTIKQDRTEPNIGSRPVPVAPDAATTVAAVRLPARNSGRDHFETAIPRPSAGPPIFLLNCSYLI